MANNCYFDLHVTCKNPEGVSAILDAFDLDVDSPSANPIGAISYTCIYDKGHHKTKEFGYGDYFAYIDGDCKWSVQSAILDKNRLQEIISKYKLNLEIYSEEPGCGFMEHYLWEEGELVLSESADFALIHIDNIQDDEEWADEFFNSLIVKKTCITKDNYESFADDDGYIKVGGYDYMWTVN